MVQYVSTPVLSLVMIPPEAFCFDLSFVVKSGLILSQELPPVVDAKT